MDPYLLERSADYHGKELLDLVHAARTSDAGTSRLTNLESSEDLSNRKLSTSSSDERDSSKSASRAKMISFIARKADRLFSERLYSDHKKRLHSKRYQGANNSSDQNISDDDETWTQAELDADKCADHTLKRQNSQRAGDDSDTKLKNIQTKYLESEMPPVETFMDIPSKYRREHLCKFVEHGDVVIGSVDQVSDRGLHMFMICFDNQKKRDLERVKFNLFCPMKNVLNSAKHLGLKLNTATPTTSTSQSPSSSSTTAPPSFKTQLGSNFQTNDLVRCIVSGYNPSTEVCEVSLYTSNKSIKLGPITAEELPAYYQSIEYYEKDPCSFQRELSHSELFNNPAGVRILCKKFGLSSLPKHSLMSTLDNFEVAEEDMADNLYKKQNFNLALKSVQRGITLLKENKSHDAILSFNKALSIDEKNVEAFVARGALLANQGEYLRAIKDLEQALEIDPNHSNAKSYLKEVFVANAVKLEKQESYEEAITYLKKSLQMDPNNEQVINRLQNVKNKLIDSYSKSQFGPALPRNNPSSSSHSDHESSRSKNKKKKHKSRHRSSSSSSSSRFNSPESSSHSNRKLNSSSENLRSKADHVAQSSYRHSSSVSSDSRPSDSIHKPRRTSLPGENNEQKRARLEPEKRGREKKAASSESEEEDMEAFFNRLKTNKGGQSSAPNSVTKKKFH